MIDYSKIKRALLSEGRSELCTLFEPQALVNLSTNLDTLKEEHPDDPLIKMLWMYQQMTADTLPLTFIASSVLELLQEKEIKDKYPRCACIVCLELFNALIAHGELRSAIFIIKDFIISPKAHYFESQEDFKSIQEILLSTLEDETKQSIKRREGSAYIQSLSDISEKVKTTKPPKIKKNSQTNIPLPDDKNSNTPPTVLSQNSSTENSVTDIFTLGTVITSQHTPYKKKSEPATIPKYKKPSAIPKAFFFLLLIIGISYIAYALSPHLALRSIWRNKEISEIIYEPSIDQYVLIPERTAPKAFSLDSLGPNLEDINKRLAKLGIQKNTSGQTVNTPVANVSPPDYSEVESLNTVPDSSSASPEPIQTADAKKTSTPVPVLPTTPQIGKPLDLGTSTHASGRIQGTTISPDSLKKTPEGRTYGPPEIQDPTKGKKSERALDGSILQSYEVERFDPPLVFETITATNVLAAPSLMSQTITRLMSSTPIHVTAKMGLWLELRSNEGKVGYIFAQDAIEKR